MSDMLIHKISNRFYHLGSWVLNQKAFHSFSFFSHSSASCTLISSFLMLQPNTLWKTKLLTQCSVIKEFSSIDGAQQSKLSCNSWYQYAFLNTQDVGIVIILSICQSFQIFTDVVDRFNQWVTNEKLTKTLFHQNVHVSSYR